MRHAVRPASFKQGSFNQLSDMIVNSHILEMPEIEARANEILESDKLKQISPLEIKGVSEAHKPLLAKDTEVNLFTDEHLRHLAKFSALELSPPIHLSSHRKILGPLIVALKKATWPLIATHLQGLFAQLTEFSSRSLIMLCRQITEIDSLKKRLSSLEIEQQTIRTSVEKNQNPY